MRRTVACISLAVIASSIAVALQESQLTLVGQVVGTTVNLSWSGPAGVSITGYRLQAGSAPGLANLAVVDVGLTTEFTSGQVPAGEYYIRVSANLASNVTVTSNEVALTIQGCAVPPAPGPVTATVTGSVVDISWAPVAGASSVQYVLEVGSQRGSSDLARFDVGPSPRMTASGPNGAYYVRARAQNACGMFGRAPGRRLAASDRNSDPGGG